MRHVVTLVTPGNGLRTLRDDSEDRVAGGRTTCRSAAHKTRILEKIGLTPKPDEGSAGSRPITRAEVDDLDDTRLRQAMTVGPDPPADHCTPSSRAVRGDLINVIS